MAMELSECFVGAGCYDGAEFSPDKKAGLGAGAGEHFVVDDLLDFSNEDAAGNDGRLFDNVNSAGDSNSCSLSGGDNQFSASFGSRSLGDSGFSGELCVPEWQYEDLAELEWLSNFVEDSFSTKHSLQQPLTALPGNPAAPKSSSSDPTSLPGQPTATHHHPIFLSETPLPSKSRSKRPRAVPCDWTTRLLHLTPAEHDPAKPPKTSTPKKQHEPSHGPVEPRRCLHCASEKTPQWRTGPMGPKTLCNACGVRYKSGRLVPEYRPAASPTFISTKHSNSHRKVMELRRQKEAHRTTNHQQFSPMFAPGLNAVDEFLIGPGFRQLTM